MWCSTVVGALILTVIAILEERELRHRFGAAHTAYAAAVPTLFFPIPFLPLPPSLAAKHDADMKSARKKAMLRRQQGDHTDEQTSADAVVVEKAFADDDTEDAVPTIVHDTDVTPRGAVGVCGIPPSTPDPYEFRERDEKQQQVPRGTETMEDAAAMFPDADELLSAMTTSDNVPSSSNAASARAAKTKKME